MTAVTDFWTFVTDPANRETLSWIGGTLVAIGGAAMAMLKLTARKGKNNMDDPDDSKTPPFVKNRAGRDATVAGGDISQNSGNTTNTVTGLAGWQLVAVIALLSGVALVVIPWIGDNVSATDGSTAIGGNVSGSTITTGE